MLRFSWWFGCESLLFGNEQQRSVRCFRVLAPVYAFISLDFRQNWWTRLKCVLPPSYYWSILWIFAIIWHRKLLSNILPPLSTSMTTFFILSHLPLGSKRITGVKLTWEKCSLSHVMGTGPRRSAICSTRMTKSRTRQHLILLNRMTTGRWICKVPLSRAT